MASQITESISWIEQSQTLYSSCKIIYFLQWTEIEDVLIKEQRNTCRYFEHDEVIMAVPATDKQRHWGKWWEGHKDDMLNSFWKDATHDKSIQRHRTHISIKPFKEHIKAVADIKTHTEVCRSLRICCTVLCKKNRFNCSSKIIVLWFHRFATVMKETKFAENKDNTLPCPCC